LGGELIVRYRLFSFAMILKSPSNSVKFISIDTLLALQD